MNKIIALLAVSLVSTAQAAVLLEKVSYPGFVMPSYALTKSCTLSDTGLLTQSYTLSGMNSKRNQTLVINKTAIVSNINQAATGIVSSDIFPVDAPTISYRAYQKQANGTMKMITLYEENGGSGFKKTNSAVAAVTLKNFIDVNCDH